MATFAFVDQRVGIGDLDIFVPLAAMLGRLYVLYIDDKPGEFGDFYLWQDESTGALNHELVYQQPVYVPITANRMGAGACANTQRRTHPRQARARAKKNGRTKGESKPVARRGAAKKSRRKRQRQRRRRRRGGGYREEIASGQRARRRKALESAPVQARLAQSTERTPPALDGGVRGAAAASVPMLNATPVFVGTGLPFRPSCGSQNRQRPRTVPSMLRMANSLRSV